jgi:hypothetical protein
MDMGAKPGEAHGDGEEVDADGSALRMPLMFSFTHMIIAC